MKFLYTYKKKFKRYWMQIIIRFIGGKDMATVYTTLIVRGLKKYSEVPAVLQPEVKRQLEALELGYLAQKLIKS